MLFARRADICALFALILGLFATLAAPLGGARAADGPALANLPGLWIGEGRLGFKDGQIETVTCRATYFAEPDASHLRQTIRCASPSGKIELKSTLAENGGQLSGSWKEEMYNLEGVLSGNVTARGLHVVVKGQDLDANMEVVVKDRRQIVEIQFHNTRLVGLTLILNRTSSANEGS